MNEKVTIPPTVGRKVWFYQGGATLPGDWAIHPYVDAPEPMDATIVYVWNHSLVNLVVMDHAGYMHRMTSVSLVQPGDPLQDGCYAMWMPYQVGQAAKG